VGLHGRSFHTLRRALADGTSPESTVNLCGGHQGLAPSNFEFSNSLHEAERSVGRSVAASRRHVTATQHNTTHSSLWLN